ncbi:MAG: hypothetical protein IT462_08375 [Planctomycetes bacterium]|nr:hypothetical protein [Planctomycetota bacterium]
MNTIHKYQPSGRFGLLGLVIAPLTALAAGVGLAYVYQFLIELIPFIYINILLTVLFGVCIGVAAGFALRIGQCRNSMIAIFVAITGGVAGVGAGHQFAYMHKMVEYDDAAAAAAKVDPEDVWEPLTLERYLQWRVDSGWSIGKSNSTSTDLSGVTVYVIWAIEALVVCGAAAAMARMMCLRPYCEDCEAWLQQKTLGVIPSVNPGPLEQAVKAGDLVGAMTPTQVAGSPQRLTYTLAHCPQCEKTMFLSGKFEWDEIKGKKKERKSKVLVEHVAVKPEQVDALMQTIANPTQPVAPPAQVRAPLPGPGQLKPVKVPLPGKKL